MNQILYDRDAAVAYAVRYAIDYNPAFGNWAKAGGDCANFVSQCLYAGGLPMKRTGLRQWYYDTPNARYTKATSSWKGAQSLRVFLKHNQEEPKLPIEFLSTPYGLQKGDIVWALNDDGTSKASKTAHHVVMVDHVTPDGEIFIHGHTANKRNERWVYSREDTLYGKFGDYIMLSNLDPEQEAPPILEDVPQSDPNPDYRLLRYRAGVSMQNGSDVAAVQAQLIQLGYGPGPVDGWYGPLTRAAVVEFQQVQGIRVDGIVGPETRTTFDKKKRNENEPGVFVRYCIRSAHPYREGGRHRPRGIPTMR